MGDLHPWMELHSGRRFHPDTFTPDDVDILDLAHAISMICRYGGHTKRLYVVAEHSCLAHDYALRRYDARVAYAALIHDAHEGLVGDMTRPMKDVNPEFKQQEARVEAVVREALSFPSDVEGHVKFIDNRIIVDERAKVMRRSNNVWGQDGEKPLGVRFMPIRGRFPWLMKRAFMKRFEARCRDFGYLDLLPG